MAYYKSYKMINDDSRVIEGLNRVVSKLYLGYIFLYISCLNRGNSVNLKKIAKYSWVSGSMIVYINRKFIKIGIIKRARLDEFDNIMYYFNPLICYEWFLKKELLDLFKDDNDRLFWFNSLDYKKQYDSRSTGEVIEY
jgi:hypothetical protein